MTEANEWCVRNAYGNKRFHEGVNRCDRPTIHYTIKWMQLMFLLGHPAIRKFKMTRRLLDGTWNRIMITGIMIEGEKKRDTVR